MGESSSAAPVKNYQPFQSVQNVVPDYHVSSPAPRDVWLKLYRHDPEALPSQSPEWLDCICAFGGYRDASRLYSFADGQQLLLPSVARKALPKQFSIQASFPHAWGMGGVLSQYGLRPEDLVAVFKDLTKHNGLGISLLPNPRQGDVWRAAQPKGIMEIARRAHVIDLEGGFDRVWQERFTSQTRNKVRRAQKSGLIVESGNSGRLVSVFYSLFQLSVDRWAEKQREPKWLAQWRANQRDPLKKLEHIARYMGEACWVWVAWHGSRPAAAILVMYGRNADYMMGAMNKELAAPTNANDLLQKHAIEAACRLGCRYYHMGESGASEGIGRFKERLGAHAYPYTEYRLERFPLSKLDRGLRGIIKRAIGFKDA